MLRQVVLALLLSAPSALHVAHARAAPARLRPVVMAVPKVPYKQQNSDTAQWVDIFNRMYRERIMFLSQGIDDDFANTIIAVLLYLESEDANSPVSMYFNVPGGVMKSGLALQDTMANMPYDIQTVNMGMAAQVSAFLIAGGTPGKRFALPNARFVLQARGPTAAAPASGHRRHLPLLAEPEHRAARRREGQPAHAHHASHGDASRGGRGLARQAAHARGFFAVHG